MKFITKDILKPPQFRDYYSISDSVQTTRSNYHIGDIIGTGGNAVVCDCIDANGHEWAMKLLLSLSRKSRIRFEQETDILKQLNHPHIIKFVDGGEITDALNSKKRIVSIPFVIMEKADMNIFDLMKANDRIEYDVYAPQIRGLADALARLHQYAIHRDIKPENILIRGETWLLSDFGLCSAIAEENQLDVTGTQERIGPRYWMSPEAIDKVYFGANDIDATSDVFQMCAVFWFVITRRYPLGMIDDDDYAAFDCAVCREILSSLKYCKEKRHQTAAEFYACLEKATIKKDED
jgi:serine/threonine-protein kinase